MKKIILAIDSFKGCLSSAEVEQCVAETIRSVYPQCEIISLPIADGGEGILDVLVRTTGGHFITAEAHDPLMRLRKARYGVLGDGKTAVIEMAEISGLPLVEEESRNPLITTTYGTGELIADALKNGYRNLLIGIGGSATNDAGLGMLQALGASIFNKNNESLGYGGRIMNETAYIDTSKLIPELNEATFTIACDVQNPFCGPDGAAYVFGKQKGGTPEQLNILDMGMKHLAEIIRIQTGKDIETLPGAGAAGGLGGCFYAFLNAELKPGIELMLDAVKFDSFLSGSDLVITGEGKSDNQTLQGKVPEGVMKRARKHNVPTLLIAGKIEDTKELEAAGFKKLIQVSPNTLPLTEAMKPDVARENIRRTISSLFNR
ncbi:glycerate kinase [uncultured Bacteroides sp.]|uniref:glycerate kinase family protein n=1 Tax=uncultured Bacteroides sp. TaxID=162156 RepID=UPI0026378FBD|nr:glycerate kinase [uncultured Bacteroides sp.]